MPGRAWGRLAAAAWLLAGRRAQGRRRVARGGGARALELLPGETSAVLLGMAPSISTCTFLVGDPREAAARLRERTREILRLNPWLGGRLDQARDEARPVLVYGPAAERDDPTLGGAFFFEPAPPGGAPGGALSHRTPYRDVARALGRLLVKTGSACLGRADEPLFRVAVVPDALQPEGRWALVVSLSHVIADGHTFYQVHNMLSDGREVRALEPRRAADVPGLAEAAMGGDGGFLANPRPGLLLSLLSAGLLGALVGPACAVDLRYVDDAYVARAKAEAAQAGTAPFVSTNDIVTSEVLVSSRCSLGLMDVNLRGRVPGCGAGLAGNYEDKIVYRPADFASPALVRASVQDPARLVRASEPRTSLPRSVRELWGVDSMACVSNWASFAEDVVLEGHRAELHVPVFDASAVPARVFTGCFVFRPGNGQPLALALAGKPHVLARVAAEARAVGECVRWGRG